VTHRWLVGLLLPATLSLTTPASAVSSAELYQNQTYTYGRFEARLLFAAGDGVISSFFLWKPGSEMPGTFWNELDFEKLGAGCRLQTNPLYGAPVVDHSRIADLQGDLCAEYHTYAFEWTPTYIAYLVDGIEIRRDDEATATAFAANAAGGMQIHFNIWPGDASFGGNFNPAILPVRQYVSWVQYSSYSAGAFVPQWREDFAGGTLPSGWAVGNWASPKNLSTHAAANVVFANGFTVLSMTADNATGFAGEPPPDNEPAPPGSGGAGGAGSSDPGPSTAGASTSGASAAGASAAGASAPGASAPGASAPGGASGASGANDQSPIGAGGAAGAARTEPLSTEPRGAKSRDGCSFGPHGARDRASLIVGGLLSLFAARRRRRASS